jgi:hypothetical protein
MTAQQKLTVGGRQASILALRPVQRIAGEFLKSHINESISIRWAGPARN